MLNVSIKFLVCVKVNLHFFITKKSAKMNVLIAKMNIRQLCQAQVGPRKSKIPFKVYQTLSQPGRLTKA
jgi:hypothetical protein